MLGPLRDLNRLAVDVQSGDYSARVVERGPNELRELSRAVNRMTEKVSLQILRLRGLLLAVSHEVRTPLTRMRLLLEGVSGEAKNKISEEVSVVDALLETLLAEERLRQKELSISEVEIREWFESYSESIEGNAFLIDEVSSAKVKIDEELFRMVVDGIRKNCDRHARTGVEVLGRESQAGYLLEFRDRGPGFPDAIIQSWTADKVELPTAANDHGYGLYVVRDLVQSMGGTVELANHESGALVRLRL